MTLLRGDWREQYHSTPEVFQVGCAGRTSCRGAARRTPQHFLHGIREFEINREMRTRPIAWRTFAGALCRFRPSLEASLRTRLMRQLHSYVAQHFEQSVRRLLDDPTLGDQLLVNFFCYALDLEPLEKQGLLEALSLGTRAERLEEVLDFQLHLSKSGLIEPPSGRSH
jgi:Lon protease-like protein